MSEISQASFQEALGYEFRDETHLSLALTHKSHANEQNAGGYDNERLEFLGDAVLDLALSECLMRLFPADNEGGLSKKRASLVNEETLSRLALELRLDGLIRLGKGEIKTGGLQKPRILASSLEAVFGAVFFDGGYEAALQATRKLFASLLDEVGRSEIDFRHDYKTRLQEKTQVTHRLAPIYRVENETGPDHDKSFEVSVRLNDHFVATGVGRSKKAAEQDAARKALEILK